MYPWFNDVWLEWQRAIEHKRVSAATLIVTQSGFGVEQLREKMIQGLLCETQSSGCGRCHSCRLLSAHSHPDLHIICPEKPGKALTVDQIRQANRVALESSQQGGARVISIEQADMMTESAANALLKTLEEPPEQCYFLLSTVQRHRLLPTILSRCQQLSLVQPSSHVIAAWLATQYSDVIPDYVLRLNNYAPLAALDFIRNNQLDQLNSLTNEFCHYLSAPVEQLYSCVDFLMKEPNDYLHWLWYLLTDAQKVSLGMSIHALPGSHKVSELLSYNALFQQSRALAELLADVTNFSGLNLELLITNWLLNFKEVLCS